MLSQLIKLIKILNSDASPSQISIAIVLALFVGLTPLLSLHNIMIFLLVCFLRINISAFLLFSLLFALLGWALQPLSLAIGEALLTSEGLHPIWVGLYQSDFWLALRFNHTLVLGGATLALLLALPLYFVSSFIIVQYREQVMERFNRMGLSKWLKTTEFYQRYLEQ